MLNFLPSLIDGVPTQARDLGQAQDATAPPLHRQQPDKASPILLVQACQDTIDRPMLMSDVAVRMKVTSCTRTDVSGSTCCV